VWSTGVLLVLVMAVAVFLAPRLFRRKPMDTVSGTLLLTGVSPRPDATGEQYVTISGVIKGPTVDEYTVYQRMAIDVDHWPTVGQLIPVMYSPKNPDHWIIAPPEPLEPPELPFN
jgi:hypothetical protein